MPYPVALGRIPPDLAAFNGAFLYCTDCSAAHRISQTDRSPIYLDDGTLTSADDLQRFLGAHVEHRFRLLRRSSDAEMLSHARWDPMCRVAWEASDGESDFVVTFGRTDLGSPRQYAIFPGRLLVENECVELDAEALRRVIDEALYPHAAPESKIEPVVELCQRAIATIPSDRFEPVDEERDDPSVQLACLPPSVVEALLGEARRRFSASEAERLAQVVGDDLRRDIPLIRVTRRYRIQSLG
jgi:hypothetical protein